MAGDHCVCRSQSQLPHVPAPAIEVICNGFALRFKSQAAHNLPCCRNSQVAYKFAVCHRFYLTEHLLQRWVKRERMHLQS
jgi:hypothetical protein